MPKAQWNQGLEKSLVDLLHEHDDPCSRGDNGWESEAWDHMVKLFNARNGVNFTKFQIKDKEKEMKRDYMLLKEARKQSGVSWDDVRCTIVANANLWENMILVSYFTNITTAGPCLKLLLFSSINYFSLLVCRHGKGLKNSGEDLPPI